MGGGQVKRNLMSSSETVSETVGLCSFQQFSADKEMLFLTTLHFS